MDDANVSPPVGDNCWSEDCCNIDSTLRWNSNRICIGTWNVEGLTEVKLFEIRTYMNLHGVDVFCIQETRQSGSDYYVTDDGFLVVLSGGSDGGREWAGVGFIVAPRLKKHVDGFCQVSSKVASLKVKCSGGRFGLISVYAPHNLKNLNEKWAFYEELGDHLQRLSVNV